MIDLHTHVVPFDLDYSVDDDPRWPTVVAVDPTNADVVIAGSVYRRVQRGAWDHQTRLEEMDGQGVELQLVSPMPELLSYWSRPASAAAFCARMNEWLATYVDGGGGRFAGLGIVPCQDLDLSGRELDHICELGLAGVELGANVNGTSIGSPWFRTLIAEIAARDLLLFVHAFQPPAMSQIAYAPAAQAITFPLDIGFAAQALIVDGALAGTEAPRVLFSHGGGAASLTIGRVQGLWEGSEEFRELLPMSPMACLRRAHFDTLLFAPEALDFLIDTVGASQVVVGSDYPFSRHRPGWPLQECRHSDPSVLGAIERDNAVALLGRNWKETGLKGDSVVAGPANHEKGLL